MAEQSNYVLATASRDANVPSDAGLVNAIVRGQKDALAEAYDRHGASVYHFTCRLCGPRQAEEVTREVFLALWRAPDEIADSDRRSLRLSLLVEAHGRAVDRLRADTARRAREASMSADDVEQKVLSDSWPSEAIRNLLSTLPDAERQAVTLAYFGGYTYKQVAALVQQPEETVKRDIATGLRRLRANHVDCHALTDCVRTAPPIGGRKEGSRD